MDYGNAAKPEKSANSCDEFFSWPKKTTTDLKKNIGMQTTPNILTNNWNIVKLLNTFSSKELYVTIFPCTMNAFKLKSKILNTYSYVHAMVLQ